MRHRITLVAFLLFAFHFSKAQTSFEPGYLLVSQTDTVRGFIDYKNWSYNPEAISFKQLPEAQAKTYGLSDLQGFFVHGELYTKAEVEIDISSEKIDELSYSPLPKLEKTVVFLQVLSGGPKGLYYLKARNNRVHLYISDKPDHYQLLINHKYLANGGSAQIVVVPHFREQLKNFFSTCDGLVADNTKISYSSRAIGKLFEAFYEKCSSQKPAVSYKSERPVSQFGIVAGMTGSKLRFEGVYDPKVSDPNFPMSYNIAGGLFFNLMIPRVKQKFSIYNELAFTSYETSESYRTEFTDNNFIRVTNTFGYGYFKLANMARYYILPAGNFKVFLNAGITNAIAISETNERVTESRFYTPEPEISKNVILGSTRKYEFGLALGVGASYKRLGAELRYESSDGMSDFSNLKSTIQRNYFMLSYRFK